MQPFLKSCQNKPTFHIMAQGDGLHYDKRLVQSLDHSTLSPNLQTINVMSLSTNLSKTLVALNLAESFAQAGLKTLFLEVNFRHPVFHTYFNLDASQGLSHWMVEETLPIIKYQENLDILASGSPMDDILGFLVGRNFKQLIQALKGVYDKIIIDTPSLSEHLDALITSDYACGNIIIHDANSRY